MSSQGWADDHKGSFLPNPLGLQSYVVFSDRYFYTDRLPEVDGQMLSWKALMGRWMGTKELDPTEAWPQGQVALPVVDLAAKRFGSLQFGDPLEKARFFGRPDQFRPLREAYCELIYSRCGFQLNFEQGALACLTFFIGPDRTMAATSQQVHFCQPSLLGGPILNAMTHQANLLKWLGVPQLQHRQAGESMLYYHQAGMILEFVLNPKGYLKRWNLFPAPMAA